MAKALLLGLAVAAGGVGCGQKANSQPGSSTENTGKIVMNLDLGNGVTLSSLSWTISNPALIGADRTGTVPLDHSQAIQFVVGGLPAGSGYTITLNATTEGTSVLTCLGTATFSITSGVTSPVSVNLLCGGGGSVDAGSGSVIINGGVTISSSCAAVSSLSASASEVDVGYPISLSAAGVDANGSGTGIGFTWAQTGGTGAGTFGSAAAAATSFTCTQAGPVTVTVTAALTSSTATCTGNTKAVNLLCDTPASASDAGTTPPPPVDSGTTTPPDTGTTPPPPVDSGTTPPPDAGTGVSPCAAYNGGAPCTATEQRLVDKSPDCYTCLADKGCLDDTLYGDTGHECGDLTGTAAAGAKTGTARTDLCLATLDCALKAPSCASTDVNICYCGSLGAGNGCATATSGADGTCLQAEIDGLEHVSTDAPSAVLPDYTSLTLGSGIANQIFVCAVSNGCQAACTQ